MKGVNNLTPAINITSPSLTQLNFEFSHDKYRYILLSSDIGSSRIINEDLLTSLNTFIFV